MMQIGMTSEQIKNATSTDMIDWQRELCWQMAKLREQLQPRKPVYDPMNDPPSLR
jgi:hypothetical protein